VAGGGPAALVFRDAPLSHSKLRVRRDPHDLLRGVELYQKGRIPQEIAVE
jgi:hypothetical protein